MTRMNPMIGSALMVWITTAALAGQTPSTTASNRSVASRATAQTVTGCIERADQLQGAGTAGTTADSQQFVLIRAQVGSGKTTAKPSAKSLGPMYRLVADAQKLNPHVGHKVEIVGTVEAASDTRASSTDASPSTAARLTVQSIKMLAETCGR
jgi:hypothetical protein